MRCKLFLLTVYQRFKFVNADKRHAGAPLVYREQPLFYPPIDCRAVDAEHPLRAVYANVQGALCGGCCGHMPSAIGTHCLAACN